MQVLRRLFQRDHLSAAASLLSCARSAAQAPAASALPSSVWQPTSTCRSPELSGSLLASPRPVKVANEHVLSHG